MDRKELVNLVSTVKDAIEEKISIGDSIAGMDGNRARYLINRGGLGCVNEAEMKMLANYVEKFTKIGDALRVTFSFERLKKINANYKPTTALIIAGIVIFILVKIIPVINSNVERNEILDSCPVSYQEINASVEIPERMSLDDSYLVLRNQYNEKVRYRILSGQSTLYNRVHGLTNSKSKLAVLHVKEGVRIFDLDDPEFIQVAEFKTIGRDLFTLKDSVWIQSYLAKGVDRLPTSVNQALRLKSTNIIVGFN